MPADFDPQKAVDRYRTAIADRDAATTPEAHEEYDRIAAKMRQRWKEWDGDDALHEMAFGEPVE